MLLLVKKLRRMSKQSKLSIAGGCAMNCVAISKIRQSKLFEEIYVPPASGDAGTSIGAAYLATSENVKNIQQIKSAALGPSFNNKIIKEWIDRLHIKSKFIMRCILEAKSTHNKTYLSYKNWIQSVIGSLTFFFVQL